LGITVSYWKDEASVAAWKANTTHLFAQKMGIERWYEHYELRVAKVERAYNGPSGRSV
jgi:heme-degrading monooxygenase HmoA